MMTKKELLERASKVYANPNLMYCPAWKCMAEYDRDTGYYTWGASWNSLTNSDNALDLVTRLQLSVMAHEDGISVSDKAGRVIVEVNYDDERVSSANEAMRLAITTAAAAAATEVMGCSEVPN
jgi:hypothetical protein